MSIWTTTTSSPGLDTPLGSLTQTQQQQHQQQQHQQQQQTKQNEHRKSSSTSINNQIPQTNHKTQSSPGSLANILSSSGSHLINHSPSGVGGGVTAHSNNAIHIGVAVGAASTLASSIIHHSSGSNHNNNNNNSNNNNGSGNCTYPQQRHSLSQSQILSYSPPNPNKQVNCAGIENFLDFKLNN
ncbi:hypothetical protein CVS40_10680 [Lucilia cuprina]|nr:hypothetical protein CVS40_10680 [Lucilia cuprina]